MIGRLYKRIFLLLQLAIIVSVSNAQPTRYVDLVNPFVGTAPLLDTAIIGYTPPPGWRVWAGLTYPGSTLPNAMVQLSPITEYHTGSGYQYEDTVIYGFTHTNKGHWNLCNIPVLPVSGNNHSKGHFQSRFSHKNESASPAFYHVFLEDGQIDVRLTSTLRCGYHQYTFRNAGDKQILFDLSKANNGVRNWEIKMIDAHTVEGYQDIGNEKVFFYALLSSPIARLEKEKIRRNGYALLHLEDDDKQQVELKIGLSYVSSANAQMNLEQEIGARTFDDVHRSGEQIWEQLLSKVQIKGGTSKQKQLFYSSLYRVFQWPALRSDINGEYTDVKQNVVKADFSYYTVPSLWDTYRNKLVLLSMLSPRVTTDVIKSLQDMGDKTGFIPTFFHGDHAAAFIASAYKRGVTDFDVADVYRLLLNNAFKDGGTRPHLPEYMEKGYIATPQIDAPWVETKAKAGVSKTLEYAFDDYAVAQLSKELGDSDNYELLMKRSKNYRNVFDPSSRFMRGRLADGSWVKNFNPEYPYYEYMYREANGWQMSFFVPHDMPGLIGLYGGAKNFEIKLDSFFTMPWNPNYIARNISGFIGQYCHGNQPDHEAPYAYYFIDKPEKSQRILDTIMSRLYGIGDGGLALCGMDDAGEMSAWYVFAAAGLYPFNVVDGQYVVSVPLFDEVIWTLDEHAPFTMKRQGSSRVLKEIRANGEVNAGYFIPFSLMKQGGVVEVRAE